MISFIREDSVAREFGALAQTSGKVAIAAPFWGQGAAARLGILPEMDARILCRFDAPSCNPRALKELHASGATIRSQPRLHAKLYLAGHGVIVGSSNPSRFGVTMDGDIIGGTIEGNILTDAPNVVQDVRSLFEELWGNPTTIEITAAMIDAEIARRDALPPLSPPRALAAKSLLAACREAPALFDRVVVGAYDEGLGAIGEQTLQKLQKQARSPTGEIGAADFKSAWGYQFDEGPPDGVWIIDLDCTTSSPKVGGTSRVPDPALRMIVTGENELVPTVPGVIRVPGAIGTFPLSPGDKKDIASVAEQLVVENRFVPLSEVITMIDQLRAAKPQS